MKQIFRNTVIILTLALGAFACDNDDDIGNISFSVISQNNNYREGEKHGLPEVNMVITNQADWNDMISKVGIDESLAKKKIDFSKYQIIAVFDKVYGNGGWSIDVTTVIGYPEKIVITIKNLNLGNMINVITEPYQIIKIPRSDKRIEFNRIY